MDSSLQRRERGMCDEDTYVVVKNYKAMKARQKVVVAVRPPRK